MTQPLSDHSDYACEFCGDTGLVRVHGHEDYGVSFESEVCEHCAAGLQHLEPEEREERFQAVVRIAAEYLSMTQCPYFDHEGTCESGCHQEPACTVDQPTEGWAGAALKALESVLVEIDEEPPCAVAPSAEGVCTFPGLDAESSAEVDRRLNELASDEEER